jgi:formyltetrahydrofolate hydrolase
MVGTTAKISGFLAGRHGHITDMQQFDDVLSNRFFIRCTFSRDTELSPAILDRVVHRANSIELKGESMRKLRGKTTT